MKKFIGSLFIGGIVGWFIASGADGSSFTLSLYSIAFEISVLFSAISLLLIGMSFVNIAKLKSLANKEVTGDEEDVKEDRLYKLFSDMTLASTVSVILSIVAFAVIAITDQSIVLTIIVAATAFSAAMINYRSPSYMKYVHPERDFPSVNDKEYAKKLFEMSDEGERHIMLQGLYKSFTIGNALLLFAMIGCVFYSVYSNESQLFSIIVMALILIVMNMQYMLKVRNR